MPNLDPGVSVCATELVTRNASTGRVVPSGDRETVYSSIRRYSNQDF